MRRIITLFLTLLLLFGLSVPVFAEEKQAEESAFSDEDTGEKLDPKVDAMIAWAMEIAEDDSHGYSQANRHGPDYDCTSFVCTALMEGGFQLDHFLSCGGMVRELPALGFAVYRKGETEPQRGDILVKLGVHAEICMGDGACVASHQAYGNRRSGDQNGHEIDYRSPDGYCCYFCRKAQYQYILRYEALEIEAQRRTMEAMLDCLAAIPDTLEQIIQ